MHEQTSEHFAAAYWTLLTQTEFDLCFYEEHYKRNLLVSRVLSWTPRIITTITAMAWMQWNEVEWLRQLCLYVIFAMQAAEVLINHLPYQARVSELRDLINELQPLFRELEAQWREIEEGQLTLAEINAAIMERTQQVDQVKRHYLKEDELSENAKIVRRASDKMERYFQHY